MQKTTPSVLGIANSGLALQELDPKRGLAPAILLQYWQFVLCWEWLVLGITAAALTFGLVATLFATPQLTSTPRIEISRVQKNVENVDSLDPAEAGLDLEFYQTQYWLLQARSLAERVARQLRIGTSEAFFEAHGVGADGVAVRDVKCSLGRLHSVHAHVFGIVFTKLKHQNAGYVYGGAYESLN